MEKELSKEGSRLADIAFNTATQLYNSEAGLNKVEMARLVTIAIAEAVKPYKNAVESFVNEFPEVETDEPMSGSGTVDSVCQLYEMFKPLTQ
jgi:hypothetical protein